MQVQVLLDFLEGMKATMSQKHSSSTYVQLQEHQSQRAELRQREPVFEKLTTTQQSLTKSGHFAVKEIKDLMEKVHRLANDRFSNSTIFLLELVGHFVELRSSFIVAITLLLCYTTIVGE